MVIELRGVEFNNKGAHLMLHAIMNSVRAHIADVAFVMNNGVNAPVDQLRECNIYVKRNGRRFAAAEGLVPIRLRRNLGYVLEKEVDVVLDSSGFAYGDQWGAHYAERRLGANIVRWKAQGKKVILLPQAFGPFDDPALRAVMTRIFTHSDLVFAREEASYEYLKSVLKMDNTRIAPDFTNLVQGRVPTGFDTEKYQVAVIPNYKMLKHDEDEGQAYLGFLREAILEICKSGLSPYFLIHEGRADKTIAEKVNKSLNAPIPILMEGDPVAIKGVIGSSSFIVCSRFHGVVSALSQGVPCITTSWSHKYEMLLNEYNYNEGLIKELKDYRAVREMVRTLADPAQNRLVSQKLSLHAGIQKKKSLEMWKSVFETIYK